MSDQQQNQELVRAVKYLEESDEPLRSNVSAIVNASKSGEFTIEDVLSLYADRHSENGVVYPSTVSQLRELQKALDTETTHSTGPLEDICEPNTLVRTEDDVVMHALELYNADDISTERRQRAIKELVKDAHRTGIELDPDKVIQSIREFQSAEEYKRSDVDVSPSEVTLATGITTPDEVVAEEEYVYKVDVIDDAKIENIDWYVGGNHAGSGKTILHTFEYPGVYTLSVEVESKTGQSDYLNKEITVDGVSEVNVSITGDKQVRTGEPVTFEADVVSRNVIVESLSWEIDQTRIGSGKSITHTFQDGGDHTISVTANTASGDSAIDSFDVEVIQTTDITTTLDVVDTAYVGEQITVEARVQTDNTYIEEVTCTVDGEPVSVNDAPNNSFTYRFDEPGEHEVTLSAASGAGDSSITTEFIQCYIEPEVSIEKSADVVVLGDTVELSASSSTDSSINWGVKNASLQRVTGDSAIVEFNSKGDDEATVTVESENEIGDVAKDTVEITVHEPIVDVVVSAPEKSRVGSIAEFNVADSTVEHAEITSIEWTINDGTVLGSGPDIAYEFSQAGRHEVKATINTDRGISDTGSAVVEVKPETNVTAIAIVKDGETTRDTFTLDAGKSVSENVSIDSYTWVIDNEVEKEGERVEFETDEPGEHIAKLTVTSSDGDVDTDTEEFVVEPYTNVSASITGPESVIVGEAANFNARDSEAENTTIERYQWYLNEKPVGEGRTFTQTFSTPGHYTVKVETVSSTDDIDTASVGVTVESQESVVEPRIHVRDETVTGTVEFSAEDTTVKHGKAMSYEWVIDGKRVGTSEKITETFSETGTVDVELTVTADDGVEESVSETVYIVPDPNEPPEDVDDSDSKTDVLDKIVSVYEGPLPTYARNWFADQLIRKATTNGITITGSEVEAYVDDESDVVNSNVVELDDVDDTLVEPAQNIDSDTSSSKTEEIVWDVGSGSDSVAEEDEGVVVEEKVDDVDDSGDEEQSEAESEWDMGGGSSDEETTTDEEDQIVIDDSEETEENDELSESDGSDRTESFTPPNESETTFDEVETPDEDLVDVGEVAGDERGLHLEDRNPPEQYDVGDSVLSMPNYAQDIVDFEYVFEENDDLLPEDVNGAGVVVTQDDQYIGIARVEGRDWAIHTVQKQRDIVKSFESNFLSALENHIQIVSLPTKFDLGNHVDRIEGVLERSKDDPDELLMNIGRSIYPNWIEGFMDQNDMKERQFYIVVPLSAEKLYEFKGGGESVMEQLADIRFIGGVFDRFTEEKGADITKYQILRELNTRMDRMSGNLRRIDVNMERVNDRNEAMAVLYHYFHNMEPKMQVFPRGPFTTSEQDAEIGGVSVGHLLEGEPNERVKDNE